MSDREHNPFKVGDKVKVIPASMEDLSEYFKEYNHHSFAVVNWVDDTLVGTNLDKIGSHYTHYELYKEEKGMNQQTQQKTKRVPFTHELWEKWKDKGGKVVCKHTGKQVLQFAYFPAADHRYRCLYLTMPETLVRAGNADDLELEIPITTKRIPFNPELKDAKVFHGKIEMVEWIQLKSGFVCGTYESPFSFKGFESALYHPQELEMEVEEDV